MYAYAPNPVEWVDPRGLAKDKGGKGKNNSAANTKRKQPCPKNVCEGKDPAATAKSWQGRNPYYGVDSYQNVVVKEGTVLYTLYPHGDEPGNYLARSSDMLKAGTARGYNDAVQVAHKENWRNEKVRNMRNELHSFVLTKDTCIAKGTAKENWHLGEGGGTQFFIENSDKKNLKSSFNVKYRR